MWRNPRPLYQLAARGEVESYLDAKQQTVSNKTDHAYQEIN